ncbi:hypothetical protein CTZ29_06795 [Bacillus halotolerans]|nr:hypothetical protein CTZ29_06795 [Bacillus halotolerans]
MKELIVNGQFEETMKGVFIYVDKTTHNTVNNPNGTAISFGSHSNNTVVNNNNKGDNEFEEVTKLLLAEIKKSELNPEKQEELNELVDAANSEITAEKPKKAVLKSFIDSADSIIKTASNSVNLISAFEKWQNFFFKKLTSM